MAEKTGQVARYESALGKSQARYAQMISEMMGAKEVAGAEIPEEYKQIAELYKTGGTYGAGQRALLEETLKAGLGKEQAALIAAGMSSGSMAAGAKSRYARSLAAGYMGIEDVRTEKLTAALSAVAAAKEARGIRLTGAYATTAQMIQGFREPTTSEFASAEDLAKMEQQTQMSSALLGYAARMKEIKATQEEAAKTREYETTERAKYTAPVSGRYSLTI